MKIPERWEDPRTRRVDLVVGFLIALLIVAVVTWIIATYPKNWRQPPPQPPLPGIVVVIGLIGAG